MVLLKFFGKEAIFSIVAAIRKPSQVDTATSNKIRPSYARVKVEVDLMKELPKRVNVGMKKKTREIVDKWISIKYDYLPKYCKTCKLQGHGEEECFALCVELFNRKNDSKVEGDKKIKDDKNIKKDKEKAQQDNEEFKEPKQKGTSPRWKDTQRGVIIQRWDQRSKKG